MNPDLDLTLTRIIRAPRSRVWWAWTDPAAFARWWLPAPMTCRVERLEPSAGGALVTTMSEDGSTFTPHLDGCFLRADEPQRIVFTTAIDSGWRPADGDSLRITADIRLLEHPDGTDYRVLVRHGDRRSREHHEQLGFERGWGTVIEQLARVSEGAAPAS